MPFPLNLIFGNLEALVVEILRLVGSLIATALLRPLITYVVIPLLEATIFKPESLTSPGLLQGAALGFWKLSAAVSAGIALLGAAWGAFTRNLSIFSSQPRDVRELMEAAALWAAVLLGGYAFMSTLLTVANAVTSTLLQESSAIAAFSNLASAGLGAGAASVVIYLFWPATLLMFVGVLLWVVVVWIMRYVDLIFYVGLLPATAALTFTGNKTAFQWNFNEAVGAVLSQMAMAVTWYVAWSILGNGFLPKGPVTTTTFGQSFIHLLIGAAAFTLVAKAPTMLQQITGHHNAGVAGLALGVAAGSVLGKEARSAVLMSPAGQAISHMGKAQQEKATVTAASWANRPSVGERISSSRAGRAVAMAGRQIAGTKVGRAVGAAADVVSGVPAQVAQTTGEVWQAGKESFGAFADRGLALAQSADRKVPGFRRFGGAMQGVLGGLGETAMGTVEGAGGVVHRSAAATIRAVRATASMAVQPQVTLGRSMERSLGEGGQARFEADNNRIVAEAAMPMGERGTRALERINEDRVGRAMKDVKDRYGGKDDEPNPMTARLQRLRRNPSKASDSQRWEG